MNEEKWHFGREIPLALIVAFIIQFCGFVWFAATWRADFVNLEDKMATHSVRGGHEAATIRIERVELTLERVTKTADENNKMLRDIYRILGPVRPHPNGP